MEHQELYERLKAKLERARARFETSRSWLQRYKLFVEIKDLTHDVEKLRRMVPSDPTEEDAKWILEHLVSLPRWWQADWSREDEEEKPARFAGRYWFTDPVTTHSYRHGWT